MITKEIEQLKQINKMEIQVKSVREYGNNRLKPVNTTAKLFMELMGKKDITEHHIKYMKLLGYKVVERTETKEY